MDLSRTRKLSINVQVLGFISGFKLKSYFYLITYSR